MWDNLPGQFDQWAGHGFWALVGCIIKTILVPIQRNVKAFATTLFVGLPVAVLMGGMASEYGMKPSACYGCAALCGMLGQEGVLWLLNNRKDMGTLAKQGLTNLVEKYTK